MTDREKTETAVDLLLAEQKVELICAREDVGRTRANVLTSLFERTKDQFAITRAMVNLTIHAREDLAHLEETV